MNICNKESHVFIKDIFVEEITLLSVLLKNFTIIRYNFRMIIYGHSFKQVNGGKNILIINRFFFLDKMTLLRLLTWFLTRNFKNYPAFIVKSSIFFFVYDFYFFVYELDLELLLSWFGIMNKECYNVVIWITLIE